MLFILCLFFLFSPAHANSPPQAVILTVVKEGSLSDQMVSVGTFTPYNDVTLKAEASGCIEKVHVKEGATVKEGQKIFSLKANEARANLKKTKAAVKLAKNNLIRSQKLKAKNFISLQAVEQAESELETAEAEFVLAKEDLEKTAICAPFGGVLSVKKVSKGAYVSPGQELIRIQDLDPIRLVFHLPQKDIALLKINDSIRAKIDAYPDKIFEGKIEAIEHSINETNRSFTVYASFDNKSQLLIPGLYGNVYPKPGSLGEKTLLIPEQALVTHPEGTCVYKKIDNKVIRTKVKLGIRTTDQVEIIAGLQSGDEIVLEGQDKLHDGDVITGTYNVHH